MTATVKPTRENVNLSHGTLGTGETPLALVKATIANIFVTMGCTYDADYSATQAAFWVRLDVTGSADIDAILTANGWRYSSKRRMAWVHIVNDDAILFLAELGIDAMQYATIPVKPKTTETKNTVAPMTTSKDFDKELDKRESDKAKSASKAKEETKTDTQLSKVELLKKQLEEAEAAERAEVARKEAEARVKAERDAKAKADKASAKSSAPKSTDGNLLAEWDLEKLYAKLEDTQATFALLIAEIKARK